MTYDITLVPHRPGQDWEQAVEQATQRTEAEPELDDRRRQQWREIERRVRGLVGDVDSTLDETAGELAHPSTGLQVSLFSHEAAVSYPYWDQSDQQGFHRFVADVVRAVEEVTGLSAYDPQTGREFDGTPDDARGLEVRRRLEQEDEARDEARGDVPHRPPGDAGLAEDRHRARRYLGIGAVLTLVAAVYLLTVRTSPLVVLALVVGVVDLAVGGYFALRVRRRTSG
jgi:hypothetical protein